MSPRNPPSNTRIILACLIASGGVAAGLVAIRFAGPPSNLSPRPAGAVALDSAGEAAESPAESGDREAGSLLGSTQEAATRPRVVEGGDGEVTVRLTDNAIVAGVKRFGINLSPRVIFGAGHIMKNLIPNPGFENALFSSMIHVDKGATANRVPQAFWETAWNNDAYGIGQPAGFWNGGEYEFVFGRARGRTGTIRDFRLEDNRYTFYLDEDGEAPDEWDVLIVRTELPGMDAWPAMNTAIVDPNEARPGSPGRQSLRLRNEDGSSRGYYLHYDSEWRDGDQQAGKLLVVQGPWQFAFWAKAKRKGDAVRIRFFREGEAEFVNELVRLEEEWKHYSLPFEVKAGVDRVSGYGPNDYHPLVTLALEAERPGAEVWIDDVALFRTDYTNPTAFADPLVEKLKELRPGLLRNWSNQLGDTLDNQLAPEWGRKTVGFSPRARRGDEFCYSLHEFLELCREIGAEPWYVIPPTFSRTDLAGLMDYLAAPDDGSRRHAKQRAALGQAAPWTEVFPKIHLEFGNEMWGSATNQDPFFGASALGGERLGRIAADRFALLAANRYYDESKFNFIIGGQASFPGRQGEIESASAMHQSIALAPYFGHLERYGSDEEVFYPLFAAAIEEVTTGRIHASAEEIRKRGRPTRLAVYEINFHTTGGDLPPEVRNDFVTGAGGALALPLRLLHNLKTFEMRDQCAFTSLGFSFKIGDGDYVRLWGMLRDLIATGRKRPTWLGVELVNRAIQGNLVETKLEGSNPRIRLEPVNDLERGLEWPLIQSFAFQDGARRSLLLFNLDLKSPHEVRISSPKPPSTAATVHQLAPEDLHADNEDREAVAIVTRELSDFSAEYELTLPRHSLTAIVWNDR